MNAFKTVLLYVLGGAFLGEVLATLIARSSIPWYYTPGRGQELVSSRFPETAVAILSDMLKFQLGGVGVGAVAGLIVGILIVRAFARRAASAASSESAAPKH